MQRFTNNGLLPLNLTNLKLKNFTTMKHNFFDRIQQTATSWPVRGIFIVIIALLFILPLYDLITGSMSYKVWTMLIISTLLLLYESVVIYIAGNWDESRQQMHIPLFCFVCISLVVLACCVAFYLDFFTNFVLYPYFIPLIIAVLGIMVVVFIYYSNNHIKSRKRK